MRNSEFSAYETFPVHTITRYDISVLLNKVCPTNTSPMSSNDTRLTNTFCNWFSYTYGVLLKKESNETERNELITELCKASWAHEFK
jgi:hypothetical protein